MSSHDRNLRRIQRLPKALRDMIDRGELAPDRAVRLTGLPERDAIRLARSALPYADFRTAVKAARGEPSLEDLGRAAREQRTERGAKKDLHRALERIDQLQAAVDAFGRYSSEPPKRIDPPAMRTGRRRAAAVALLSDVHAEERVTRTPAIPNEYGLAVAQHRVGRFFSGVQWLTEDARRATFDVHELILWLGGDLISGDIHEELAETGECPPGEAMLRIRDWILSGVRGLRRAMPDIAITMPCSFGNHGRTTKRMRASTGYGHSWEWILYQILAHDLADDPGVRVYSTPDEMQYVETLDFTLAFSHGHMLKYNGGIGGLTIPAVKAMHRWEQWRACDYYHFGHFHTRLDLEQMLFNGSVIGPSPFSFHIGARPEEARQSFYVLDANRGKTMSSPVWVEES